MTRAMRLAVGGAVGFLLVVIGVDLMLAASAQVVKPFAIGFLGLKFDPRYDENRARMRSRLHPQGDAVAGAALAVADSQFIGAEINVDFRLEIYRGANATELASTVRAWRDEKAVRFFILDLPGDVVAELSELTKDDGVLLINATAPDVRLRREACSRYLFHTAPSYAMQMDALVQYLVSKRWTRILMLEGPLPEDATVSEAFRDSADRHGAKIVDTRPFILGNDPRRRDQNNIALLTGGRRDYDVVFVADTDGEFGRYVPYQTNRPRPVVGTTGLTPSWWHWSFERYGAPQLNSRFEKAHGRRMLDQDWGTWVAVRAIVQSVLRVRSTEFEKVTAFMRGDRLRIDGFKGPALSFRPWNNQLRQPILIATHDAMIKTAPVDGFLHETETLDTLGDDRANSSCRF